MRVAHTLVGQRYPKLTTLKTLKYGAVYTSAAEAFGRQPVAGGRQPVAGGQWPRIRVADGR